jgi:hypothetical protein
MFDPLPLHAPLQVYHQEGTTLGDDSSDQKQKLMTENKAKFVSKWSQLLGGETARQ